jgi:sulfotransferase family protein
MVPLGREPERVTARSAIPDVVIGGAPRSGTTFLCELLAKHPQVYVARPYIPEPKVCMTPHPAGDAGLLDRYASFFADAPPQSVRVEKTSYYLENSEARERLVRLLPQARFVFIMREPVARAYSNWSRTRSQGLEKLPFEEAVELDERARPVPLPSDRAYARPFDYLTRGQYGTFAQAWINAVEDARVSFYLFEEFITAPESFVDNLQRFVGVEPLPWSRISTGRINAGEDDARTIDVALAARLRRRFAPEVERLALLTGLDVSIWGY